jgi:putative tryptophan/tyrosine transport system substrate-binding protein
VRRREFIAAIYGAALVLPGSAAAEQPGKVWRLGDVPPFTPEEGGHFARTLEQRLADLGDVEGRNIALLHRFAGPQPDKLQEAVASLVRQIDLLVVWGPIAGAAARKLAGGVPTVFISISFPVEIGLVQSLAHPGGNINGIAAEAATETYGKRLQILKEIAPDLKRVAVLSPVGDPNVGLYMESLGLAARELGVILLPVEIKSADDLGTAFAGIRESEAQALMVIRSALFAQLAKRIADLALVARLPSCYALKPAVMAGGLVSLDSSLGDMIRPATVQIDKIIKGTSPAEIPVEQPTKLDLVINLKPPECSGSRSRRRCSRWPTR